MPFSKRRLPDGNDTDEENDAQIDPELRLRTVRTAASTLAESIRAESRAERRKSMRRKTSRFFRKGASEKKRPTTASSDVGTTSTVVPGERRNVYINHPLSAMEVDHHGEPVKTYVRNKVRTSKYTIITFIPKNLYEQFRRVANLYFLALTVVQVFPVFGAASPQISMLPLVFILAVTAIKDGIEDYRRARLDDEVNNSATTKLGNWRNVNQPTDPRSWLERILGLNAPGSVTKGVRKLREREANAGHIMLSKSTDSDDRNSIATTQEGPNGSRVWGASGRRLEDIQSVDIESVDSHSYPPASMSGPSKSTLVNTSQQLVNPLPYAANEAGMRSDSLSITQTTRSFGVVDYNKRTAGSARWERTLWKKLEVGDIVLLRDNEQVPADIVVLSTSDPDGACFLETKNLDGETNLKPRKSVQATSAITSEDDIERSSFFLDSEPPHQNLYLYHGVLKYKDPVSGEPKQESVTINEFLLRGCTVRNTTWIIGLVVFTGADTKIMLNGGETPSKRSKIEKETNFNVIMNFIALFLMCAVAAIVSGLMDARSGTSADVFEVGADPTSSYVLNALVTFISCLIAFQNIVPISLYISIEIVKTIQAYFISQDVDMYYKPFDTACVPKTWNISDDLGQIEYVFSDKTGTLTQNIMEFQKCSIYGVAYGEGVTEAQRGAAKRQGAVPDMDPEEQQQNLVVLKEKMVETLQRAFKNRYGRVDKLTLISPKLAQDLTDRSNEQRTRIIAFFRALAICHSVLADRPEPDSNPFLTEYKAESPDEAALVAAARDVGFPFVSRSKDSVDIEVMGQMERYTPLKTLEFNSTRKRMSVIVRNSEGKIILYCKGADSVIYERLDKAHDPWLKEQTTKDMEAFANGGLRTLCIAYRYLTDDEYFQWSRVYDAATQSIKDRDEEIDKANEQIEHSLTILGATALEDKLQEGVPEAIETLHRAGIKLWILTGDKVQTAIEIGFSCNLLKNDMEIMILSADSPESARAQIEAGLNKIASVLGPPSWDPKKRGFIQGTTKASFAVVIDGDTLRYALDPALKPLFLNLGTQCETVVCCRVSPAQKALTVKLVKEGRNAMTLSIGDGANDVAMIQEANIGCGLFGLEGSQAAMSADYAFGQFRFLTKLLLVHGRWSYQRIADMHSNFFYKNVIWTFAMFWYLPWNSFDATYLYEYTFILLYNLVFTSLPVIVLGAFDQDINAQAALAFPQLYVRGIRGLEYTRTKFWLYMLDGLYQSAVVYFIPFCVWYFGSPVSWNGKGIDSLADFGTTVSVAAIFAANTYVGISTNYWTAIAWIINIGSSLVMIIWIAVYSVFDSPDFNDEVVVLYSNIIFWASVIVSVVLALAPRFLIKFVSTTYSPLDKDIVREMWVKGDLKDRLGIKHRRELKKSDLEATPMFQKPHTRSESEFSTLHQDYEPALTSSPGNRGISAPRTAGYVNTPSSSPAPGYEEVPPNQQPQYAYSQSRFRDQDHLQTPPSADSWGRVSPASLRASYYSASDIPAPSPLPSPKFGYGSNTTNPLPPSALSPTFSAAGRSGPTSPSHQTLQIPTYADHGSPSAELFEMRIRSPSIDDGRLPTPPPEHSTVTRGPSEVSYATAPEELDEGGYEHDRRASTVSYSGPRAL
ncbi:phospholipid-translocating P-type ATPase [Neolentinus lepideus HHB14362 ss-1]|uniref:Phospholipid-transporting ATPase n=1 Tax=Neolentinus lepideus HHB14362 ss-1 TaxID=1314782 RepID=A0A165SRE6_9AGAM|nr:phospholipid-translocating P-type ATPase [Neolentinus lepideus HHB14362 ss-1]